MDQHITNFARTLFFGTCLALGCTSGGSLGCGSSGGGPKVDSELLAVYQIDTYQVSEGSCDQLNDATPPAGYLALYSFVPNDQLDEARLGGIFCVSVDACREVVALAPEPAIGYSFIQGSDQAGWVGYAISSSGAANDQCRAEVQVHTLTTTGTDTILIDTRAVETTFPPMLDGTVATCRNADAIASINAQSPCVQVFRLEATRQASL
jgi:hypothetical protein